MLDVESIKQSVIGKWPGIIDSLGIGIRKDGKHSPCPMCGGKDRFRFDNKEGNGTWICNQCGAGDGWQLVVKAFNIDFIEAVKRVGSLSGNIDCTYTPEEKPDPKIRLRELWKESEPYKDSGLIKDYLLSRGLRITPHNLRFINKCYEPDTKQCYPAMLGIVQNGTDSSVTIHRTYLDGPKKAPIEKPKKLMPAVEHLNNVAIRLFDPNSENNVKGIAEGIETGIAATQLFDIPTWAAINSTLLTTWEPPEKIKTVVIFGDNDANFTGHKAAYILANKLYLKGIKVEVQIPDEVGDWNDVLIKHKP